MRADFKVRDNANHGFVFYRSMDPGVRRGDSFVNVVMRAALKSLQGALVLPWQNLKLKRVLPWQNLKLKRVLPWQNLKLKRVLPWQNLKLKRVLPWQNLKLKLVRFARILRSPPATLQHRKYCN
jgi:hypothetical protein